MKIEELLVAILEEQKRTNEILASIRDASKNQIDSMQGRAGQADVIMQQAMQILTQHAGGKQ